MVSALLALLIPFLGCEDWHVRKKIHFVVEYIVFCSDKIDPVIEGSKKSKSAEARIRCKRIVSNYRSVYIPESLSLRHFDNNFPNSMWAASTENDQVYNYVKRLFENENLTRRQVVSIINKARSNKSSEDYKKISRFIPRIEWGPK